MFLCKFTESPPKYRGEWDDYAHFRDETSTTGLDWNWMFLENEKWKEKVRTFVMIAKELLKNYLKWMISLYSNWSKNTNSLAISFLLFRKKRKMLVGAE